MASKKVLNAINNGTGLYVNYGPRNQYLAGAGQHPVTGKYGIDYLDGELPNGEETFGTIDELEAAMRTIQPDLRRWKTAIEDEE